ncbi:MAG: MucR family transcriptional regulator [Deltaproteobacteria bacterium]|nr:MucR family transcriptional regulator [Deltaproteobacteria bacterium]
MATLLEMAVEMVKTRLASTPSSKVSNEEMMAQIRELYAQLLELSKGEEEVGNRAGSANMLGGEVLAEPSIPPKKAFKKDKVICLICGKEMKTLSRHLKAAHEMSPKEYRQKFGIDKKQPLAAKTYSENRRQMAIVRGLGENLAKARANKRKSREKGKLEKVVNNEE